MSECFQKGVNEAPKVLGDIIESLIGAIYLDSMGCLETTWQIIQPLLEPFYTPETVPLHPISELMQLAQVYYFSLN